MMNKGHSKVYLLWILAEACKGLMVDIVMPALLMISPVINPYDQPTLSPLVITGGILNKSVGGYR